MSNSKAPLLLALMLVLGIGSCSFGAPVIRVAAGGSHTVALKSDGTVCAWGDNFSGQLGDWTTTGRSTPVQVSCLTGVTAVAAGWSHTVALKGDGTVWAWGANWSGQIGDGSSGNGRSNPVRVSALTGVTTVAAGYDHTVALKSDGTVWTWGDNDHGQLGNGTTTKKTTPAQVTGLTGVTAIAAGYYHTVVMKGDGTVWAWGDNGSGQLGDGTIWNDRATPVQVSGLSGVTAIAAGGHHTVALNSDGIWAWGGNQCGQLGNGNTSNQYAPVHVPGLIGATAVAAGDYYTVALKSDGTVWAWGDNQYGQLGHETATWPSPPAQVTGLTGATSISAGASHTLALTNDGTVWAWGDNHDGKLGNGTATDKSIPVQVSGLSGVAAIAAGQLHTVALKTDGTVQAWGWNTYGQVGDGTTSNEKPLPVQVSGLAGATAIAAGWAHTLAVMDDGTVRAWGHNTSGQLGDGTYTQRTTPVEVLALSEITAAAAGHGHTVALKNDGTVWTWGSGSKGQLGNGSTSGRHTPGQVAGISGVVAVTAGYNHTAALKSDGTVWTWGDNHCGQIGDGTTNDRRVPAQVRGLTEVKAIAAGQYHTAALRSDGTVWAWGDNYCGQLGDKTYIQRTAPVQVSELTGIASIAAGWIHTLALKANGTVWGWGDNHFWQLGAGANDYQWFVPVQISQLSAATAVAAGSYHTVALMDDTTVWAVGDDDCGQLGDGESASNPVPLPVIGLGAAPPVGSIVINGGAEVTKNKTVTLTLQAEVEGGTITQMRISNDGLFDTEPMEPYVQSKSWALSASLGTEPVTVYARFRSSLGSETDTVTATIIRDTPVKINTVTVAPSMVAAGDSVLLTVRAGYLGEAPSVAADGVALAKTGSDTWTGYLTAASALGTHDIAVSAADSLGHSDDRTASYKTAAVVGLAGRNLSNQTVVAASSRWLFRIWGKVTINSPAMFTVTTSSGTSIKVVAPLYTGIANGDYVSVRGILSPTGSPPTMQAKGAHVVRYQ